MAYKVLLIGNDTNTKDLFFDKMGDDLFCVSSSRRMKDLKWHTEIFKPDAVVYCMLDEDSKYFPSIANYRREVLGQSRRFILVGPASECRAFQSMTANCADREIADPESSQMLKDTVVAIIENRAGAEAQKASGASSSWADIMSQLDSEMVASRKHILVVDDDPLMLKVIKDYLHDDYEVATAKSGSIAYKFLERKSTDLILLDYEMPEEKGPEVLMKIRELPGVAKIPVIFLTGVRDKERLVEIVKLKPQGYISKPVDRQALFEMIAKVMPS